MPAMAHLFILGFLLVNKTKVILLLNHQGIKSYESRQNRIHRICLVG